jgi:hypothetical protein
MFTAYCANLALVKLENMHYHSDNNILNNYTALKTSTFPKIMQ